MAILPGFGNSFVSSELDLILQDLLADQGSLLTVEIGSLAWCECYAAARAVQAALNFLRLLSAQLNASTMSVLNSRYANIYAQPNNPSLQQYLQENQALFATIPNYSNVETVLQEILGQIFINIQFVPELQPTATRSALLPSQIYVSPLSRMLVYVWQPRDNQDNLLMSNPVFIGTVENYHTIIGKWLPSYNTEQTYNLIERGAQDGYDGGYNGLNYNNYLDGYNVISGSAGSTIITGTGTTFQTFPENGEYTDFSLSINEGFFPPIQVVDDQNELQTYEVVSVQSNTQLTIAAPGLINNVTNRTYRMLGIPMDTNGVLDGGALLNNSYG